MFMNNSLTANIKNQNSSEFSSSYLNSLQNQSKNKIFRNKSPSSCFNGKFRNFKQKNEFDYLNLIQKKKALIESLKPKPHTTPLTQSKGSKICVCVRKRPIFDKEISNGEIDCISALNPKLCVYDCKVKIDGITKYIDTTDFYFDNVFHEKESTQTLYQCTIESTMSLLKQGGIVTCFAYGQTGSGKTYTMKGIQDRAIYDLYNTFANDKVCFYVSFYEIYAGRLYDLLNNRNKVMALEDKNQKVQIYGLEEKKVDSPQEMQNVVDYANTMRTTHNTVTNETSSRSHAICNFVIKKIHRYDEIEYAKLTLVDLAGSERATETQSNNKSRLAEGAEINKSLLALKECIRALDIKKNENNDQHVPFRTSKLTLVLRDSFISKNNNSKIIMISCISPCSSCANHTINTLRYADRLKEKTAQSIKTTKNSNGKENNINNANVNHSNGFGKLSGCGGILQFDKKIYANNNNNNTITSNSSSYNSKSQSKKTFQSFKPKSQTVMKVINDRYNNKNNSKSPNQNNYYNNLKNNKVIFVKKSPVSSNMLTSYNNVDADVKEFEEMSEDNIENCIMNPVPINRPISHHSQIQNNKKTISPLQKSNPCKLVGKHQTTKSYTVEFNIMKEMNQEENDKLIMSHMNIIKEEAKALSEEGAMISSIKGIGGNGEDGLSMEEYTKKLSGIIDKKMEQYMQLKMKIKELQKPKNTLITSYN